MRQETVVEAESQDLPAAPEATHACSQAHACMHDLSPAAQLFAHPPRVVSQTAEEGPCEALHVKVSEGAQDPSGTYQSLQTPIPRNVERPACGRSVEGKRNSARFREHSSKHEEHRTRTHSAQHDEHQTLYHGNDNDDTSMQPGEDVVHGSAKSAQCMKTVASENSEDDKESNDEELEAHQNSDVEVFVVEDARSQEASVEDANQSRDSSGTARREVRTHEVHTVSPVPAAVPCSPAQGQQQASASIPPCSHSLKPRLVNTPVLLRPEVQDNTGSTPVQDNAIVHGNTPVQGNTAQGSDPVQGKKKITPAQSSRQASAAKAVLRLKATAHSPAKKNLLKLPSATQATLAHALGVHSMLRRAARGG